MSLISPFKEIVNKFENNEEKTENLIPYFIFFYNFFNGSIALGV